MSNNTLLFASLEPQWHINKTKEINSEIVMSYKDVYPIPTCRWWKVTLFFLTNASQPWSWALALSVYRFRIKLEDHSASEKCHLSLKSWKYLTHSLLHLLFYLNKMVRWKYAIGDIMHSPNKYYYSTWKNSFVKKFNSPDNDCTCPIVIAFLPTWSCSIKAYSIYFFYGTYPSKKLCQFKS